jgi:hypothetical protein
MRTLVVTLSIDEQLRSIEGEPDSLAGPEEIQAGSLHLRQVEQLLDDCRVDGAEATKRFYGSLRRRRRCCGVQALAARV